MKKTVLVIVLIITLATNCAVAQKANGKKSDRFRADLEKFIVSDAQLTSQETARFLPLHREMMDRQKALRKKLKANRHCKPVTEADYKKAITECDKLGIEVEQLRKQYHTKFLKVLSAKKVYGVIKAEDRFFKKALHKAGMKKPGKHRHGKVRK